VCALYIQLGQRVITVLSSLNPNANVPSFIVMQSLHEREITRSSHVFMQLSWHSATHCSGYCAVGWPELPRLPRCATVTERRPNQPTIAERSWVRSVLCAQEGKKPTPLAHSTSSRSIHFAGFPIRATSSTSHQQNLGGPSTRTT
jgi:hypothetical protein